MGLRRSHTPETLRAVQPREHGRDLDGLLTQLRGGDAESRRWAARDLASHPESAASLGQQVLSERDASVREALFTSLRALATPAAAGALLPLLRSDDAELRNSAIEALAGMPDAVSPRVAQLLQDADPDVRILTVNLLGELQHTQVPQWLVQVLRQDTAVNVVAAAIEAMAEAGGPEHVPALKDAAARFPSDPFMAFAADMAAQRIEAR